MPEPNLFQGTQSPGTETSTNRRITQTDLIPRCVKSRHLDTGLFAIRFISTDADLPTEPENERVFFIVAASALVIWDGTGYQTVTLNPL